MKHPLSDLAALFLNWLSLRQGESELLTRNPVALLVGHGFATVSLAWNQLSLSSGSAF